MGLTKDENVQILTKDESLIQAEEAGKLVESNSCSSANALTKSQQMKDTIKQRLKEQEESAESIEAKAANLAHLICDSNYAIIYTGAGISTSAAIPDYRGPNGLWTQLRKTGSFSMTQTHDLTTADPTFTHMAIKELCNRRLIKHVVSQNCDGLHLRSGIPQTMLSEIHGNMFIEVCPNCDRLYHRQADITQKTSRFRHKTGRKCHICRDPKNNNLTDTIVLYGERSRSKLPMNWERASKAANRADLIICLGSSLKTLRRYGCLWPKRSSGPKRALDTKLAIINLQYTSKDKQAVLKINGRCDLVMQIVMEKLNLKVPSYHWPLDPLCQLAIPFSIEERSVIKGRLLYESRSNQENIPDLKLESQDVSDKQNFSLPGWLTKGLGGYNSRSINRRRKRRSSSGNQGANSQKPIVDFNNNEDNGDNN